MSVTISDISKKTGFSKATISRALNNDRLIHPDTRSKVLTAAAHIGYERAPRKSKKIAKQQPRILLLLPPYAQNPENTVLQVYLRGMARAASETDCFLSVEEIPQKRDPSNNQPYIPREIKSKKVDAVVLADNHNPDDIREIPHLLPTINIQWDRGEPNVDIVSTNNYLGVAQVVKYLYEKGHQKIAWMDSYYTSSFFRDREGGYIKGCLDCGLPINPQAMLKINLPDISTHIQRLIQGGYTAFVCANDAAAIQLDSHSTKLGYSVPEDFSLIGYDGSNLKLSNGKILSSYEPDFAELGRKAIYAVLQRMKDPGSPRTHYSLEGKIVEGESVAENFKK